MPLSDKMTALKLNLLNAVRQRLNPITDNKLYEQKSSYLLQRSDGAQLTSQQSNWSRVKT